MKPAGAGPARKSWPQGSVIEKILRHCGLWNPSTPRAPPPEDGWVDEPDAEWDSQPISSEQSGELTFVDIDEFLLFPLSLR